MPQGTKVECNQFLFNRIKGNVLNTVVFDIQPTNALIEKFKGMISDFKLSEDSKKVWILIAWFMCYYNRRF